MILFFCPKVLYAKIVKKKLSKRKRKRRKINKKIVMRKNRKRKRRKKPKMTIKMTKVKKIFFFDSPFTGTSKTVFWARENPYYKRSVLVLKPGNGNY